MRNLVSFLLFLVVVNVAFGQQVQTVTDLRLRLSSASPGEFSFRHNGNGLLKSYNAAGAETASWDAETGTFTGSSGGGVAWGAITGTLSDQTDLQSALDDKPSMTTGGQFQPGASTWFSGSDTLYTNFVNFGAPGSSFYLRRQSVALQVDPNFLAVTAPNATVIADKFQGSGELLTSLNADNFSAGTLPIARGGTGLTALGTAGQVMRVNSGATGLEWYTPSSGGGTWGSITGTLSDQMDLQSALNASGRLTGGNSWIGNQTFSSGYVYVDQNFGVGGDVEVDGVANFYDDVNIDQSLAVEGSVTATSFVGSGASVTGLNAGNISAGTLSIARGGTGLTTLGAAGEVLAVNGAGTGLEFVPMSGGGGTWGSITGTLSDQTDLQTALNNKQSLNSKLTALGNFSAVGIMVHRGGGEYVARGISGGSGIIVSPSTADGIDGNPMIMLDSTVLRTNTAQIITGLKTFQNASGFLVKTSGASPGWTLMDRSTIPGRQFVFQSNTAETGANKYMVLNFWVAGSTKAAPAVNNMNYYWESDPAADPNNGRAGVFGLDITNERFVIATRNFGANYLTNASLPIQFAAGDNVGGSTQLRLEYSGGANKIGFFDATPVVRQTATDLPGVIAALKAYGLLTP